MAAISLPVALATTGAAALVNLWLTLRVGQVRRAEKISVGDGGNLRLIARMRAQLNFAEFAPLVLILLALVELARGTSLALWAVGAVFIVARILHARGMDGWTPGRAIGISLTLIIMVGLGIYAAAIPFLPEPATGPMPIVTIG